MKIKGNKKDMEKPEKPFERRRALDCEKRPCSPVGTCMCLVCVGGEPGQTSPSRTLPISLWTALLGQELGTMVRLSNSVKAGVRPSQEHPEPVLRSHLRPAQPPSDGPRAVWSTCAARNIHPVCSCHGQPHSQCRSVLVVSSTSALVFCLCGGRCLLKVSTDTVLGSLSVQPLSNA